MNIAKEKGGWLATLVLFLRKIMIDILGAVYYNQ